MDVCAGSTAIGHRNDALNSRATKLAATVISLPCARISIGVNRWQRLAGRIDMDALTKTLVLPPPVGQTLKHYRLDGVIGQGGMGVVYRAHDLKLQRPVAVKLLPTELTADADRRKRFLLEARTAARISHPAIAQIYDVDEQDGIIFIAMELVEGKTIRELIQNRQLDLLGAIDVALQVSAGLAKAHESGIIHRDIKPANVIQTPEGHVKILDFGLAKLLAADSVTSTFAGGIQNLSTLTQTQIGIVKGTPAYMSPEQIKGEAVDARSDLFSLGAMMFEMATGQVPFQRATPTEMMHAIAFDKTPAIHSIQPNLPGDLQRIVARCLKKSPTDRYPDARALIEDLRTLRRKMESGQARPLSLKERAADAFGRLMNLKPSEYVWLVGGALALAFVFYLLMTRVGVAFPIPLVVICLLVYRRIRHQPQRMVEAFVRKVARLPEVRFIACQDRRITVSVDRAPGQLYARINQQLNACNRKLFFGEPMTVVIRSDLTVEETRQSLAAPGVHYVRENATKEV
jgi:serine/threonine protein kinase